MQHRLERRDGQVELGKQQKQFLQYRRAAQAQLVAASEQIQQQVGAVQGKEIGLRVRPPRQDVVRAHRVARREIDNDNAPAKLLGGRRTIPRQVLETSL